MTNEIVVRGGIGLPNVERLIVSAPDVQRVAQGAGNAPADLPQRWVNLGQRTRHSVIRDVHNVGWWAGAEHSDPDWLLYDVTVFNVGWQTTAPGDRTSEAGGHGQALYTQNYATGGTKRIDTCVFIAGFSLPGKIYGTNSEISPNGWQIEIGEDGRARGVPAEPRPVPPWNYLSVKNKLANYRVACTVFAGKRFIVGNERTAYGAHNVTFDECVFAACRLQFGYEGLNGHGALRNCVFTHALTVGSARPAAADPHPVSGRVVSWERLEFVGNVVIVPAGQTIRVDLPGPNDPARGWRWDGNTYYSLEARPFEVTTEAGLDGRGFLTYRTERLTFDEWRARTGFDAASTFVQALPDAPIVRVFPIDEIEAANVFIYNPTRLATVARPAGWDGADVIVRDVRRWDEPLTDGALVMAGEPTPPRNYTMPPGGVTPILGTFFPEIGIFRLERAPDPLALRLDEAETRINALEKEMTMIRSVLGGAGVLGPVIGTPGGAGLFVSPADYAALWIARAQDVYADTSLTTLASDGGTVRGLRNQSSAAHMLQSGASTICPLLRASVSAFNNRAALEFDGGDHLLLSPSGGFWGPNSTATFYAVARLSATGSNVLYGEGNALFTLRVQPGINNGVAQSTTRDDFSGPTVTISGGSGYNNNAAFLMTLRRIGTAVTLRMNGVQVASGTIQGGSYTPTRVRIGASGVPSSLEFFNGQIAFVGITLADDLAVQEPKIAAHYGITI